MEKFRRLKSQKDIQLFTRLFNKLIGYSNVPWEYFSSGKCYGYYDKKKRLIAGFVLIPGYDNLRAIQQIPKYVTEEFKKNNPKIANNLCDFTGYFITQPNKVFLFTIYLTLICLFYSKKYFVYTFPIEDKTLEKYYGQGNPIRLYTGTPEHLPGHTITMMPEHVEILTRWGIVKIFLCRTKKLILSRLKWLK